MCDVVLYGDGTGLALLFTELAGQTSGLADLFDSSTTVMAGTAHGIGGRFRNELNEVTRTGGDTFAAGLAFAAVYTGNSLIYGDSAKRTGRGRCLRRKRNRECRRNGIVLPHFHSHRST